MSPPKLRLILSPQAQNDFADILQYTLETWGKAQTLSYRSPDARSISKQYINSLAGT